MVCGKGGRVMQVKIHINGSEELSFQTEEFSLIKDLLERLCEEMPKVKVEAIILDPSNHKSQRLFKSKDGK